MPIITDPDTNKYASQSKMIAFWDIAPCILFVVDRRFRGVYCLYHQNKAVRTSEKSFYYKETICRNIPEGYNLHTRSSENLKSLMPHIRLINFISVGQRCKTETTLKICTL
jgi:hypothetical protein